MVNQPYHCQTGNANRVSRYGWFSYKLSESCSWQTIAHHNLYVGSGIYIWSSKSSVQSWTGTAYGFPRTRLSVSVAVQYTQIQQSCFEIAYEAHTAVIQQLFNSVSVFNVSV